MLSASETTHRPIAIPLFLTLLLEADEVLQSSVRNLRAPALNCVQDDRCIYVIPSNHYSLFTNHYYVPGL